MLANQIEQATDEKKSTQKTCEYQGVEYFVLTDMKGKCFIYVNGKKKYLDCNGNVSNKQKGTKSILCAFGKILDMKDEIDTIKLMRLYN